MVPTVQSKSKNTFDYKIKKQWLCDKTQSHCFFINSNLNRFIIVAFVLLAKRTEKLW